MARIVFDRIDQEMLTGTEVTGYLYTLPGKEFSATVYSDKEVTFWFEYGRFEDAATDYYPFFTGIVTVPANDCRGLIVNIAAATQAARLIISNASGSTAAVIADFGSK